MREIIALELEVESEAMFDGEVEVDKSYFGGRRNRRRGRGAGGTQRLQNAVIRSRKFIV